MGFPMFIAYIIAGCFFASTAFFLTLWQRAKQISTEQQTRNHYLSEQLERSEEKRQQLTDALEEQRQARQQAETNVKLMQQQIELSERRMTDWEKTKQEHLEAAKASVLKAGSEMSSKLLDDHKREAEAAKKDSEKRIKETTTTLQQQFQTVFESMRSLNDQVQESKQTVDVVRRSLLSPSGAGALAEITLENILKNSGLVKEQDYMMQYWIRGNEASEHKGLKPDAIVMLPGDHLFVIDSKSSSYFQKLGEVGENDIETRKQHEATLKRSMQLHLQDLVKKDYKEAIEQQLRQSGRPTTQKQHITVLMFLPTETALETLRRVDSDFYNKASQSHIIPVGPSGLINMLQQARMMITNARQSENTAHIINEVKLLLASVAKLHDLADNMGKSIKSSFKRYDAFAKSFNGNFLIKTRKLNSLGITAPRGLEAKKLERYQLIENSHMIEGESEEIEEALLEDAAEE